MKYAPILTFRKRKEKSYGGKIGIWINMPLSMSSWNIWDLAKKELTPNVMDALANAFERGMEAQRLLISDSCKAQIPQIDKFIQ